MSIPQSGPSERSRLLPKPQVVERNEEIGPDKTEVKSQSMVMYVLTLIYFMMMILI
jgi:hypothetical protein